MTHVGRSVVLAVLIGLAAAQGCATTADRGGAPADGGGATVDGGHGPVTGNRLGELRDGAVAAAEQTAVALMSLDHRDPEEGYDRLLELLTEPARQEWEQRRGEYLAPITASGAVTSEPAVRASGVAALDPATATATVLVAATAAVSSSQAAAVEKRRYRLQMSLIRTPAGWRVSQLQILS